MGKITLDIDALMGGGRSLEDIIKDVNTTIEKEYDRAREAAKEQAVIDDLKKTCIENLVELHTLSAGAAPDEEEMADIKELIEQFSHKKCRNSKRNKDRIYDALWGWGIIE